VTVISLAKAREANGPHTTAPARCAACEHPWQAVVPMPLPPKLECPACHKETDAMAHARMHRAMEVLDDLREAVRTGKIVAFAAVGIEPDDATRAWATCTAPVSRLRMIGAMHHMAHMYSHGELDDE